MIPEEKLYDYCRHRISACRKAGQLEGIAAYNDVMEWIDVNKR